ncbi:hypothetical protein J4T96_gp106 [Mycobacterium phage Finemlucis]|uniref:Uncharacterized protein n=1 Tax=Mycobacterium phage Finemlucis TaxID=2015844 RepID=A0A291IA16_9CAUD|nr:hypothetical protein J4T96_gp106 [Mycobacterium phage Finemlucis]ATG86542.1 hypothetical protein SEA_FINEMLUCIS_141 [Mycobacterium phage Finemlucis]
MAVRLCCACPGCVAVRLCAARAVKRWLAVRCVLKSCSVPNP